MKRRVSGQEASSLGPEVSGTKTKAQLTAIQSLTMADVGRLAGVSAMTVSRALKKGGRVSQTTREKIIRAVDELGYVLDQSAGSLSSRKTGFIAAILPSISNSNFADTARGITQRLEGTGLQLLLGYTDYSEEQEENLVGMMLRRRPEGIILTGGTHSDRVRRMVKSAGIPAVETWDLPADPIGHVVGFSNRDATRLLVKTLAVKGYRRFCFIGGNSPRDTRGAQRRDGFIMAINELGFPPGRIISVGVPPISIEQGGRAMATLLEGWNDTDAVVCVSDLSAFGALMECKRRGMRVPDDIAVAGFGDYEVGQFSYPSITTVSVDCLGIGAKAAELLVGALQGGLYPSQETILMPFKVVEREST